MVLPSADHAPLTAWLNAVEVDAAHEMGGTVVVRGLGAISGLLRPGRLTPEVHALFEVARGGRGRLPSTAVEVVAWQALCEAVTAVLTAVCEDLASAGVAASPYSGLGVLSEDDVLECAIVVDDPLGLAAALGFSYEPRPRAT